MAIHWIVSGRASAGTLASFQSAPKSVEINTFFPTSVTIATFPGWSGAQAMMLLTGDGARGVGPTETGVISVQVRPAVSLR